MADDYDSRWRSAAERRALCNEILHLEPRLRLVAFKLLRKTIGRRHRGAPMVEISADDLVQHGILRLFAGQPPFEPARQTLFHYLLRRMDQELKRVLSRVENDTSRTFYAGEDESENIIAADHIFSGGHASVEAVNYMIRFMEWASKHQPDCHRLAELMVYEGVISAPDQAQVLGKSIEQIYKLRESLWTALRRFDRQIQAGHNQ